MGAVKENLKKELRNSKKIDMLHITICGIAISGKKDNGKGYLCHQIITVYVQTPWNKLLRKT